MVSLKGHSFVFANWEGKSGGFVGAQSSVAHTHGRDWAENVVVELSVGHLFGVQMPCQWPGGVAFLAWVRGLAECES